MRSVSRFRAPEQEKLHQSVLDAAKLPPCRNTLDTARFLVDVKRYLDAEKLLHAIGLEHPDAKPAINLLIRLYSESGRIHEAETAFSYALNKDMLASDGCASLIGLYAPSDAPTANRVFATAVGRNLADRSVFNAMINANIQNGTFEDALKLLDSAISKGLADTGTFHLALSSFLGGGHYNPAKKVLNRALRTGLADVAMVLEITDFCRKSGKIEAAIAILHNAEEKGLTSPALNRLLGELQDEFQMRDAKAPDEEPATDAPGCQTPKCEDDIIERVLGNKRVQVLSCNTRVYNHLRLGELELAYAAFRDGLRDGLIEPPVYHSLLLACRDAEDLRMAKEVFDAAVELGRADARMEYVVASIYARHGLTDMAIELLVKATAGSTNPDDYHSLFELYYTKGRYDDVLGLIARVPKEIQRHPKIIIWRLEALRKKKLYSEAISSADSLLARRDLDSDNMYLAKTIKAYALTHSGKAPEAFAMLKGLIDTMPKDHPRCLRAMCGLVFAYSLAGDDGLLPQAERAEILSRLKCLRGTRNENMNMDIENAIGILESKSQKRHYRAF